MKNVIKFNRTVKVAKAIYVVSGFREMILFLDAEQEFGTITADDNNEIVDIITAAYANVTVDELDKIRNMF